jgi:hypothetical protein
MPCFHIFNQFKPTAAFEGYVYENNSDLLWRPSQKLQCLGVVDLTHYAHVGLFSQAAQLKPPKYAMVVYDQYSCQGSALVLSQRVCVVRIGKGGIRCSAVMLGKRTGSTQAYLPVTNKDKLRFPNAL